MGCKNEFKYSRVMMTKLVIMKDYCHGRHGMHPPLQVSRSVCEILANRGYESTLKCL